MPGIFKKLENVVADVATLNVQTFTGDFTALVEGARGKSIEELNQIIAGATKTGTLSLAMSTRVELDGDTLHFIGNGATETAVRAHHEAVRAAQEYRAALLQAFGDVIGIR
jgi:hypothetical protein